MSTVKLWTDADVAAAPRVKAVFDDIRATRKSDFVILACARQSVGAAETDVGGREGGHGACSTR
jgi:hypothetical protein